GGVPGLASVAWGQGKHMQCPAAGGRCRRSNCPLIYLRLGWLSRLIGELNHTSRKLVHRCDDPPITSALVIPPGKVKRCLDVGFDGVEVWAESVLEGQR